MWQVPALTLTAQSLLVTVGLNASLVVPVRLLTLVLALGAGLLGMQLMAKQRFHEQVDTRYLQRWEQMAGIRPVANFAPHDRAIADAPDKATALDLTPSRWARLSSYKCWMWGLRLFVVALVGLFIWVLVTAFY